MLKMKSSRTVSLTLRTSLALAGALLIAGPAVAATETDSLAVGATVTANCTIGAGTLAFGAYDPVVAHASADLDGSTTVSVTCTDAATATITLGQGATPFTGSDDGTPLRQMASGDARLQYNLYTDAPGGTIWNNTTGASYTGTGGATSVTIHGRITGGQNVIAGTYADTVVSTITF